jgi:hypothetical protein
MPNNVSSTIRLDPNGGNVTCAVAANPRHSTRFTLTKFPLPSGTAVTIRQNEEANPKKRIPLGAPDDLINKAIIQCAGDIFRNLPSGDSTYRVVLRFYQGTTKVAESDEVTGDFGNANHTNFEINCRIRKQ